MRYLIILVFIIATSFVHSQQAEIKGILENVKRDSLDKTCKNLFDYYYEAFESDSGLASAKMQKATLNLFTNWNNKNLPNNQLEHLLYYYIAYTSSPDTALQYIQALKEEFAKVYGSVHPLILLYEGESLINAGKQSEAYTHFRKFQEMYPNSVMAMVYIYQTEPNHNLALTWLSILKKTHPNHWVVKQLPNN